MNLLSIFADGLKMERKPLIPARGQPSTASFEGGLGTAKTDCGERCAAGPWKRETDVRLREAVAWPRVGKLPGQPARRATLIG